MPVQIPKLQRAQAPSPSSVGRLDVKVPSEQQSIARTSNAAIGLADAVVKAGNDAVDTQNKSHIYEFERWYRTKMDGDSESGELGLRHHKGDPTPIYNEFDSEAEKRFNEISEGASHLSKEARIKFRNMLAEKYNSLYNMRLTTYGAQYSMYEQGITENGVNLEKYGAMESVGYITSDDPTSFAPFEQNLAKIRKLRLQQGLKIGTVTEDPEGDIPFVNDDGEIVKVKATESALVEIKKDFSDTVFNATKNLINGNKLDAAKSMMEKYEHQVDPVNRPKLVKLFEDAELKDRSLRNLDKIKHLPASKQIDEIEKIKDPEEKQETYRQLDARGKSQSNTERRHSKRTYDKLANHILGIMNSPEPYDSLAQLEEDSLYKGMKEDVLDTRQRQALQQMVQKPKTSNQEVRVKMFQKLGDGSFYAMSASDMAIETVGLNESDSNYFFKQWTKIKTESDSQERSRITWINKRAMDHAINQGLVKTKKGKVTAKSRKKHIDFVSRMIEEANAVPKGTPTADIEKMMRESVANEILKRKQLEGGGWLGEQLRSFMPSIFGDDEPKAEVRPETLVAPDTLRSKPDVESAIPSGDATLNQQEMKKARDAFKAAHDGRRPKNLEELLQWLKSKEQ